MNKYLKINKNINLTSFVFSQLFILRTLLYNHVYNVVLKLNSRKAIPSPSMLSLIDVLYC